MLTFDDTPCLTVELEWREGRRHSWAEQHWEPTLLVTLEQDVFSDFRRSRPETST